MTRPTRFARSLLAAVLVFCLALPPGLASSAQDAPAAPSDQPAPAGEEAAPATREWKVTADEVAANQAGGIITAKGNVVLTQGENTLKADSATYFLSSGWVSLAGNIEVHWEGYDAWAEKAELDLKEKVGWLENGLLFARETNIYVRASHFDKIGTDTYLFSQAKITACDGDRPAWSVDAGRGSVTLEGYAEAYNVSFDVFGVPVLFSPWAAVPVNTARKSGLLFPAFGSDSRLGAYYQQPIYMAFSEEQDATLYLDYYLNRGPMVGLEYRSATDAVSKGLWRADFVYDRKTAATVDELDEQFRDEGLVQPDHERYWLRGKWDGWLGSPEWEAKLDLDFVSDSTYLREYDIGHADFTTSRDDFIEAFGRGLDVIDETERVSGAMLTRNLGDFALNGRLVYTENLAYMNDNNPGDRNPTVQRLPELTAFAYKQALFETPFEWEGGSELAYFWREYGTNGSRLDLHPRLSLPLASSYGTLIPSVGWQQTSYGLSDFENTTASSSTSTFQTKGLADVRLTGFSEVFRVFELNDAPDETSAAPGDSAWTRMKHALQPRLEYNYVPNVEQDKFPDFDEEDRIEPENELRYSLTNLFDRKRALVASLEDQNGQKTTQTLIDYREFFRLRFEQAYDFREATRDTDLSQYPRRPFGDVETEATVWLDTWISLTSRTFISPYEGTVTRHEHMVRLEREALGSVYFGLDFLADIDEYTRQQDERQSMLRLGGELFLPWELTLRARYQHDFEAGEDVSKKIALTWSHQCFDLTAAFTDTPYDQRIGFWITILGFNTPSVEF
jgi:LPS-assembly protein